ncbi:hypothetical protein IU485_27760 [Nocardia cyriacigeorgica]|uniref:hypothetical protein n=1 Tax=Nocardia cyriacigeorgica TaxID=135487 RepID=UPI001895564C|nr:hypothetical protein [Nocardia cyriacigeorgica]MBF6085174.1 hypothetical protein [Nocardia cyriacigeorgica]
MTTTVDPQLFEAFYRIAHIHTDWTRWANHLNNPTVVPGYGTIELIHSITDARTTRWGEYDQGSTSPAGLVFRVIPENSGDVGLYMMNGEYDSYGRERYDGPFERVQGVEVTQTVYRPLDKS